MDQVGILPKTEISLGRFIRARRLSMGLTQEQLAERVGPNIQQSDISRLETDKIDLPRRDRMEAIAAALDVSLGDLLIATGWLEVEHAAMIRQIDDETQADPDVVEDAMAVLTAAKEWVVSAARMLERAEDHLSSITAAKAERAADGDQGYSVSTDPLV